MSRKSPRSARTGFGSYLRGRRNSPHNRKRRLGAPEPLERRALLAGDIAAFLFHDVNNSGARDAEEPELVGWTVFVDTDRSGSLEDGEPSLVTNVDGEVLFTGVADGTYSVREILPPGWAPSSGFAEQLEVEVLDGKETKIEFGNFIPQIGDLRGTVWNDHNGDAVRASTDPGLPGWTVYLDINRNRSLDLDLNNDGVADDPEPSTVTDATGQYSFLGLQAGSYRVAEVLPSGWETSGGFDVSRDVMIYTGGTAVADFANLTPEASTISGTVWTDTDGNGVRAIDPATGGYSEPGIEGWQVYVDLNGSGAPDAGEPAAVSGVDGSYALYAVPYGTQTLVQLPEAGWRPTVPSSGRYLVHVLNGVTLDGYDFGNQPLREASISGTVYVDSDHDGTRDASERGLAGITVYLDLDNDDTLDDSEPRAVTSDDMFFTPGVDEAGSYSFTHLAKGTYSVREIVPDDQGSTPDVEREHIVTVGPAEDYRGVDSGNVYRPNEIHGVKFEDRDGDHLRDIDEAGVGGVTIYIDMDRDNVLDLDEPTTVTLTDGSYAFTGLTPGAYVVREIVQAGYEQTFPMTLGGDLWPRGLSNAAVGNVTPTSISTSLAIGASHRETVSITLPNTGALTNLVDVFLLFDDTGSFTANSPIVRAAFPEIIASLQTALPGIDLGFGVGRLEEYGNFAAEDAEGRPFILWSARRAALCSA